MFIDHHYLWNDHLLLHASNRIFWIINGKFWVTILRSTRKLFRHFHFHHIDRHLPSTRSCDRFVSDSIWCCSCFVFFLFWIFRDFFAWLKAQLDRGKVITQTIVKALKCWWMLSFLELWEGRKCGTQKMFEYKTWLTGIARRRERS